MEKREKYTSVALAVLVLLITWLKWRGHPSVASPDEISGADEPSATGGGSAQQQFDAPYLYQTPGISDSPIVLNGGAPFQSTINVEVNPSYLGSLSENYIPMFGFVGMGYSGQGGNGSLQAPPPPPVYFAPPAPASSAYAPPNVYSQPSPYPKFSGSGGGGAQLNPSLLRFG